MVTFISRSAAETAGLGEDWGRGARRGLVLGLSGDLGAGKTQLVRGLARGLGIASKVHSPTFSLVNIYSGGRLPLFHLDLYRLETREQIFAAGLEDYFKPEGVTVIEWAERLAGPGDEWEAIVPAGGRFRWARFEILDETGRQIVYEDSRD
jgi:tRNA threonylcarbamoyladenosine biosynthesis protein TsaE